MQAILYDAIELGVFMMEDDKLRLKLHRNININWLPYIFVLGIQNDTDMRKVLKAWKKDRVFPKNRIGSFKMLRQLGLNKYDIDKIAEKTRCSVLTDPYWIAYNDDDTFSKCTARGTIDSSYSDFNSLGITEKDYDKYIWRK